MGKSLIQQARGKGGPRYRAPSFRYEGEARHRNVIVGSMQATIIDFVKCQGHLAPLARLKYDDGTESLIQAAEGLRVGDQVSYGPAADPNGSGNTLALKDIPDGAAVFNIESQPGDGGKFCRTSGTFAKIVGRTEAGVNVILPSKVERLFNINCRATIGVVAGSGRTEKPFLKAGVKYYKVYRKLSSESLYKVRTTTTNLSYTETIPTLSAIYYVKVYNNYDAYVTSLKINYRK